MRNRRERALKELYDVTKSLSEPKITPILEGTFHIQGPVDESDCVPRENSQIFPAETRSSSLDKNLLAKVEPGSFSSSLDKNLLAKVEPGTCNVCSAPCASCFHLNKTWPSIKSEFECGSFLKMSSRKEDDNCSSVDVSGPAFKNKAHSEQNRAISSHDSSVAVAERASVSSNASKNVEGSWKSSIDAVNSDRPSSPSLSHRNINHKKTSDLTKEKHELEHLGDSISCYSGLKGVDIEVHAQIMEIDRKDMGGSSTSSDALLAKGKEKEVQNATADNNDYKDRHNDIYKLEHLRKDSTSSSTLIVKERIQDDSDSGQNPLSRSNVSPEAQSPSQNDCSFCDTTNSKDLERVRSSDCSDEKKEAELAGEEKCINDARTSPTLASMKETDVSLQSEAGADRFPSDERMKSSKMGEQSLKPNSLKHTSNTELHQENKDAVLDTEVSEEFVDDVKICDICGDAGQEEKLAICSRCSDGAEHIYCMRIRLFEVPEDGWLCEECQMKEDSQNHGKTEAESLVIEEQCLNRNSQKIGSKYDSKHLSSMETKEIDAHLRDSKKESLDAEILSKQSMENLEVASKFHERNSEACDGSTGTIIPRKKSFLSREDSFNELDVGKLKPSNLLATSSQSEKLSHAIARSPTASDSNTSKIQTCTESIRGSMSKSYSFNSSKVPKVKQLNEVIPQKQKFTRESSSRTTRKEGPVRTITKSVSFRNVTSSNFNLDNRGEFLMKERSAVDEKNPSLSDHPSANPSSVVATSIPSAKVDEKVGQYDKKVKKIPESTNSGIRKGSDAANSLGSTEVKKHIPQLRNSGNQSFFKSEEQNSSPLSSKSSDTTHRDDKRKESASLSSSRSTASGGNRILRCRRCNETGHSTQFCAVDRLCMSALKPSSERNSREGGNKGIRRKDAVEVAISKPITKKTGGSLDKSEEISTSSADVNPEVTSKDIHLTSLNYPKTLLLKGAADAKLLECSSADSKVSATVHAKLKAADQKKTVSIPKKKDVNATYTNDSSSKINLRNLQDPAIMLAYTLSASVIPKLEFIWQGAFEVLRAGKLPTIYDGFQAHFSSFASHKAVEVATKFPYRIQLEEVPRKSSWPLHFQETSPKENNIALFFFAKDIESYEKYYQKQLDNMVKNDLALKGDIDAVELLIYPSNLLPEESQRWNTLFFLWGVFRVKEKNCLANLPDGAEKPCIANLSREPVAQHPFTQIICGLSDSQDANNKDLSKDLHGFSMTKASGSTFCVELHDVSEIDRNINEVEDTCVYETLHQAVAHDTTLVEQTSSSFPASCSSNGMNQSPGLLASCPERKIMIDIEQLPPEEEDDFAYLNKPGNDSFSRDERGQLHDDHAANVSIPHATEPLYSVPLGHVQRNERSEKKIMQTESFRKTEAALGYVLPENVLETDNKSLESRPNQKRVHSCPTEIIEPHFSCVSNPIGDKFPLGKASCTAFSDGKEHKKMKLDNGGHAPHSPNEEILACEVSSKIHPLTCSLMEDRIYSEKVSESSKGTERYLFPVDEGPTTSTKAEEVVHVISSDDEEPPEPNAPDLELALGCRKSSRDKLSTSVDAGDDDPALLSLSLAFPAPEKARPVKTVSQSEQLLPDKPSLNTSLFLFRGYNET